MKHFMFLEADRALNTAIQGEYNFLLIILSVLVAITATYTSFLLSERIQTSESRKTRIAWLLAGAVSLGTGIWSMHFIGMLAFKLPVTVTYDVLTTIISIIPALLASLIVLNTDAEKNANKSLLRLLSRSVLMGGGIGLMHYTGMAAMHMDASIMRYSLGLFSLSIVVAVVLAMISLRIKQWAEEGGSHFIPQNQVIIVASIVMGIAITSMHYTGMAAVYYFPASTAHVITKSIWDPDVMALFIALMMGGILTLLITAVFINRRLALMSKLQASETRLNTLLDSVVDGIIMIDERGFIELFNPAAEKIFGYAANEVVGKRINMLMPESTQVHHDAYMNNYHETGHKKIIGIGREEQGKRKDGSIFPIDLAISEAKVEGKKVFIGSIRDITQRKQVQLQLEEQSRELEVLNTEEHVLAELLRLALQPTEMKDYLNESLVKLFKMVSWLKIEPMGAVFLTTKQGKGQSLHLSADYKLSEELHSLCARVPFGKCLCGRAAAERTMQFADCVDHRHDIVFDGMDPHGHYSLPLLQNDIMLGVMVLYVEHGHQQTEREADYLQQVADVLGMGIGRRYTRKVLIESKEQAESAAKAKSDFLATMSHEIRTPMNGVLGMLHLLSKTRLDDKQRRFVNTASGSGEMLLTVINDILDFSKIEADKLELESIPFQPISVVEETAGLLAQSAHEKGLELISSIDPGMVKGDPIRLRQVLTNLINNAIKFTESGHIIVSAKAMGEHINFSVVDTGIGISDEQKKSLFKAFSQVDSSHTRKYGGTGLGLVISQRLVEAMGGKLQVESIANFGSEFSFELSLETVEGGLPAERISPLLIKQRILLVDDNAINREVLSGILENWGVEHITEAEDAAKALAELQRASEEGQPYDIALLDMQMPGMDGLELARLIRKDNKLSNMHLLMLSSVDRQKSLSELDAWLPKPVRQSDLFNSMVLLLGEEVQTSVINANYLESEFLYFGGQNMLLVEDNYVNQEVAREIFSEAGFDVEISENGAEAILAVQKKDYDVVLMDIQMPVMDGLEATRQIRKLGGAYSKLPIIAMTAHALTGDSDKSLEAGMNAHVTKPIDPDKIFSTIAKWIKPSEKPADMMSEIKQEESGEFPELPGINVKDGLNRMRGNQAAYKRILRVFRNKQTNNADSIASHIEQGEWEEATRLAHSLKGGGGNIGAEELYKVAAEIEVTCKDNDKEKALLQVEGLRTELSKVTNSLEILEQDDVASQTSNNNNEIFDPEQIHSLLDQLDSYLETDISEAQRCLQILEGYINGNRVESGFNELENAVNSFDMDAASAIIKRMKQKLLLAGDNTIEQTI